MGSDGLPRIDVEKSSYHKRGGWRGEQAELVKSPDYNKSHQTLSRGLQSCGHLREACPLMLGNLKVVCCRRRAVLSRNRRRSVWRSVALNNLFVSVAGRHDDEPQVGH